MNLRGSLGSVLHSIVRQMRLHRRRGTNLPFDGFEERRVATPFVDRLADADLRALNHLLPWHAFTVDKHGRRFGDAAWSGKRNEPQLVPDPRVVLLNQRFGLADKHVLEIGCFEGIHSVGLANYAKQLTAVDSRIENVVKTIVRAAFFGRYPVAFKCDVENRPLDLTLLSADVVFHVGVLYHLKDPVRHLLDLGVIAKQGLLLDTHIARDEDATDRYVVDHREIRYRRYREWGQADPFSGMYDHAKWLRLDDLTATLREAGFTEIEIVETREERNGPRVLLIASKR